MKIRFYHWWAYKLYFWLWTPILESRPAMVEAITNHMNRWLNKHGRNRA